MPQKTLNKIADELEYLVQSIGFTKENRLKFMTLVNQIREHDKDKESKASKSKDDKAKRT